MQSQGPFSRTKIRVDFPADVDRFPDASVTASVQYVDEDTLDLLGVVGPG